MIRTLYTSEAMQIGKTQWRLCIGAFDICGSVRTCTQYQWLDRRGDWRPANDWPLYDHNDTYNGLPRRLEKLYEREREKVELLLLGKPPRQLSFAF